MHIRRYCSPRMMCILVFCLLSLLPFSRATPVKDEASQLAIKAARLQHSDADTVTNIVSFPSSGRQAMARRTTWDNLAHEDAHLRQSRTLLQANQSHEEELPDISEGPQALFRTESLCRRPNHQSEGPYFVDGQYLRNNITDSQGGIDITIHLQFVDQGCRPFEGMYVDVWHANASGIYSGVRNAENAQGANLEQSNFHRGVSQTDEFGVVTFMTKFPGHSNGRTTFIHVMASYQGTVNTNGTYATDYQPIQVVTVFFDQDLQDEIAKLEPYASNTSARTRNQDDYLYTILTNGDYDPHMRYALKGDDVSKGIIGWIRIPVDLGNRQRDIRAAGTVGIPNNGGRRPISTAAPQTIDATEAGSAAVTAASSGYSSSKHNALMMALSLAALSWALLAACS